MLNEKIENEKKQEILMKKEKFTNKKAASNTGKASQSHQTGAQCSEVARQGSSELDLSDDKEAAREKYLAPKKAKR